MRLTSSIRILFWTFTQKTSADAYNGASSSAQTRLRPRNWSRILKHPKFLAKQRSCRKRCILWACVKLIWCRFCFRKSREGLKRSKSRRKSSMTTWGVNGFILSVRSSTLWAFCVKVWEILLKFFHPVRIPTRKAAEICRLTIVAMHPRKVLLRHIILILCNK